ncbi:multiple monosaccharide ABC transporter permease [Caldibacillus thermoamylovorans]|uniref:multiple monosaccharide ABC transporter permease n=1 Tax=Caldibacillus thermoamylovorans TaxID=35841 RepID=UPI00203E1867|nr:multiple monosaccharide ABC transporter permease [Caldibacillus thermoamylovorans]MCM3478723.1 sugar ABC transporter permease [Caldibacillus thermoamylovorans]
MNTLKKIISNNVRQFGMVIALVVIAILFQFLTGGVLLTPLNITNIIMQNSYIILLAFGMLIVIITGEIDLSVGSVVAFVGAVSGILLVNQDLPVIVGIFLSLLIGAAIGAFNGFWVAYVRIPAFIVTLASMLIFRGLTLVALNGETIAPFPDSFRSLSTAFIPDIFNGGNLHILTILVGALLTVVYIIFEYRNRQNDKKYNVDTSSNSLFIAKLVIAAVIINTFTFVLAQYEGIAIVLVLIFFIYLIYASMMNKTVLGRHIYAVGGNENAARLSGINSNKVKFWVFVNMGVLSALAGLIFAGRLNAATPQAGTGFELDAIAAAVIGGASMTGGVGTVFGAVIGALVMGILNNGMSIMGIGIDWQQAIKGLVLLAAVTFDILYKKKK